MKNGVKRSIPATFYVLSILSVLAAICLTMTVCSVFVSKQPEKLREITTEVKKDTTTISAYCTFYFDTGNKTFTGATPDTNTAAVSRSMLYYYCSFGDSVVIDSGFLKGKYIIQDIAASGLNVVDVWKYRNYRGKGCYLTRVRIIKN